MKFILRPCVHVLCALCVSSVFFAMLYSAILHRKER